MNGTGFRQCPHPEKTLEKASGSFRVTQQVGNNSALTRNSIGMATIRGLIRSRIQTLTVLASSPPSRRLVIILNATPYQNPTEGGSLVP